MCANAFVGVVAQSGCASNTDGSSMTSTYFCYPSGLAFDSTGNLYVGGWYSIRKIRYVDLTPSRTPTPAPTFSPATTPAPQYSVSPTPEPSWLLYSGSNTLVTGTVCTALRFTVCALNLFSMCYLVCASYLFSMCEVRIFIYIYIEILVRSPQYKNAFISIPTV